MASEDTPPYTPDAPLILQVAEGYRLLCREDWGASGRHFEDLVARYPTLSVGYSGLATVRGITKEFEECRRLIVLNEQVNAEENSQPNPYWAMARYVSIRSDSDATLYECLYGSNLALLARRWDDSETFARLAYEQAADNPYVAQYYAVSLIAVRKYDSALPLLEWICDALPSAMCWFNRGICEERLGNRRAAIHAIERCLQIVPNYQSAHQGLSWLLFLSFRWSSALQHGRIARRLTSWEKRKEGELILFVRDAEEYVARFTD